MLFVLPTLFLLLSAKEDKGLVNFSNQELVIEETFFTLDTVWTPGVRNKYPLFPYDNYLLIKDGMATMIVEENRAFSFRGPINNVEISDKNGKRTTQFAVRNAKIRVELREQDSTRYEIYVYKYLDKYERMFAATWIDLSKVSLSIEE